MLKNYTGETGCRNIRKKEIIYLIMTNFPVVNIF